MSRAAFCVESHWDVGSLESQQLRSSAVTVCPRTLRKIGLTLLCLVLFASNGTATAQVERTSDKDQDFAGLDIQVSAGWDAYVDLNAPVPVSFLLTNHSTQTIEGELILTEPHQKKTVRLGEVFIGPNSVKRFSSIQALSGWDEFIVRYEGNDQTFWRRTVSLTTGKDFSEDLSYLLFVDDGGRMLQMPTGQASMAAVTARYTPENGQGRPVQAVAVRSWQVPQHPGPLTVAQAMLIAESADVGMLNEAQWQAVARWICLGGTLMLHDKDETVLAHLKSISPLVIQPAVPLRGMMVHRCGSGSIRTYSAPLFAASDQSSVQSIVETAARLPRHNAMTLLESLDFNTWNERNSQKTRMLVLIVFACYALLSGLGSILLFRCHRKTLATYVSAVVAVACIAAVGLGSVLKNSPGDLRWTSVTQAGAGGVMQLGRIAVQSSGGRNTKAGILGRHADLQLVRDSDAFMYRHYYNSYSHEPQLPGYPAFTWQGSLLEDTADAFQVGVPITPWGSRRLIATAFDPRLEGLKCQISYSPTVEPANSGNPGAMSGRFDVRLQNRLGIDINDCRLIICRSGVKQNQSSDLETYERRIGGMQFQEDGEPGSLFRIENVCPLGMLPNNQALEVGVQDFEQEQNNQYPNQWGNNVWVTWQMIPRVPYPGGTSLWIAAQLSGSPVLQIDEARTDFEPIHDFHWFLQEIPEEDLPPSWLEFHDQQIRAQLQIAQQKSADSSVPNSTGN
jgi:hypothetical protein